MISKEREKNNDLTKLNQEFSNQLQEVFFQQFLNTRGKLTLYETLTIRYHDYAFKIENN